MERVMKATLRKMGNSHGVLIPKVIIEQLGIVGDLDMRIEGGALVLRPSRRTIELTTESSNGALTLMIHELALGEIAKHAGVYRLQNNRDHGEFYKAVLDAIVEYKKNGDCVIYNGVCF